MEKCPKCLIAGLDPDCPSCLRRQLAAANERVGELERERGGRIERKHIEAIGEAVDDLWCIDTAQNYDLCNAAISAALAALDESHWRSMDSLKADGRNVLLLFSKNDPHVVVGNKWKDFLILHESGEREAPVVADGWMPLPAAPEVK